MTDLAIRRYSNGFSIYSRCQTVYSDLTSLNMTLTHVALNRAQNKYAKYKTQGAPKQDEFYIYNKQENRFYYNNALYQQVMLILSRRHPLHVDNAFNVEEINLVPAQGDLVTFDKHVLNLVESERSPFEFQNKIVDFAMEPNSHHRIFEIQTGRGKTKMALKVAIRFGQRIMIVTKAAYIAKWIGDIEENLGISGGELCVPKTAKQFQDLLTIGEAGRMNAMDSSDKTIKVVLISSSILDNWMKQWTEQPQAVHPTELAEVLGVGMIIYDESHQLFRKNYWSFMLLNAPKFLDLSATLEPDDTDSFMKQRYYERFPLKDRYAGLEFNKYIDAYSIYYGIRDKKLRERINRMKMYNHTEFEQRLAAIPETNLAYFDMCIAIIKQWYVDIRKPEDKALIFFATRNMCTDFQTYAKLKFPDLKVTRNIEGDDYNEFISGQLCVSTPGKSATAVDIPGLILSVITVAISKRQMNLQIIGRLRDLRTTERYPKTVFLHCSDVRKHVDYLRTRRRIFDGKVRSFKILSSPFMV